MFSARALVVLSLVAMSACAAPNGVRGPTPSEAAPPVDAASLGDAWVGGFDAAEGAGAFLRVDFEAGLARLHPNEERAPLGIIRPQLGRAGGPRAENRTEVRFAIDDGKQRRTFQLQQTSADHLEGTMTDAKGAPSRAQLVRLATYERKEVDAAFAGTYAIDGDPHRLLFVDDGDLFDTRDGSERRLFLRPERRALVGAGAATAYPARAEATLDSAGALHLAGAGAGAGAVAVVAPRFDVRGEEVRFESGGAVLRGTLLSPPGPGPHPAVVNVHGSGHVTRGDHWGNVMARVFLSRGIAVLLYDKRGVGDSGGEYVGRGGRDTNNVSAENLERLAADAAAAAAFLAARKDIDASRVGLIGLSQAGWIVPLAAKQTKAVRFFVLMSGPAVNTTVELAYSALVGDGMSCLPIEEADRVAREHAPRTGFDPLPVIAALDVPGLWLYGALDASIPVPSSVRGLEPLLKSHPFSVQVIPGAGHELYVVKRDVDDERLLSPGFSPVALEAIGRWLAEHVQPPPRAR